MPILDININEKQHATLYANLNNAFQSSAALPIYSNIAISKRFLNNPQQISYSIRIFDAMARLLQVNKSCCAVHPIISRSAQSERSIIFMIKYCFNANIAKENSVLNNEFNSIVTNLCKALQTDNKSYDLLYALVDSTINNNNRYYNFKIQALQILDKIDKVLSTMNERPIDPDVLQNLITRRNNIFQKLKYIKGDEHLPVSDIQQSGDIGEILSELNLAKKELKKFIDDKKTNSIKYEKNDPHFMNLSQKIKELKQIHDCMNSKIFLQKANSLIVKYESIINEFKQNNDTSSEKYQTVQNHLDELIKYREDISKIYDNNQALQAELSKLREVRDNMKFTDEYNKELRQQVESVQQAEKKYKQLDASKVKQPTCMKEELELPLRVQSEITKTSGIYQEFISFFVEFSKFIDHKIKEDFFNEFIVANCFYIYRMYIDCKKVLFLFSKYYELSIAEELFKPIDNETKIHAEANFLDKEFLVESRSIDEHSILGISKLSCQICFDLFQEMKLTNVLRGSHGITSIGNWNLLNCFASDMHGFFVTEFQPKIYKRLIEAKKCSSLEKFHLLCQNTDLSDDDEELNTVVKPNDFDQKIKEFSSIASLFNIHYDHVSTETQIIDHDIIGQIIE